MKFMPPKSLVFKTHYTKILFLLAPSVLFTQIALGSSSFEGLYGQLSTGYEYNSFDNPTLNANFSESGENVIARSNSLSNQHAEGMPIIGEIGYIFTFQNNYTFGMGLNYTLTPQHTNNINPTWIETVAGSDNTTQFSEISYKASNRINAFLTPGYLIVPGGLLYGKMGYSIEKITYNWDAMSAVDGNTLTGFNTSKYISGYILSAGYKQMFANNWYAFGELSYSGYGKHTFSGTSQLNNNGLPGPVDFSTSSTQNISMLDALIGIGYKF